MDDLDRLFQRLVQNLRAKNPAHATLPFTVAELYEQLVPYRHNRRELGIETNQDYEIALTRLLAGERGYIRGDEAMQESLKKELSTRDPDTGAFKEFATAEVSVSPAALQERAGAGDGGGERAARAAPAPSGEPATAGAAAATAEPAQPAVEGWSQSTEMPAVSFPPDEFAVPEGCRFCGATLPEGRDVKFCPNCGQNLTLMRCVACGAEIDAGWKYCVSCGRPART